MSARMVCDFCARTLGEVDLMFRAEMGGHPPHICSDCVTTYFMVVELNRTDPDKVDQMVAACNAEVNRKARA